MPRHRRERRFSALQRAEIAEMLRYAAYAIPLASVSVLFNEPKLLKSFRAWLVIRRVVRFSALQRAEIAEINSCCPDNALGNTVSVLFNEPKLLKSLMFAKF